VSTGAGNKSIISFANGISAITLSTVGNYTLGRSALLVNSNIAINGGTSGVTLSAGTTMRLFRVTSTGNLGLVNLTLSGGTAQGLVGGNAKWGGAGGGSAGLGGAIFNQGGVLSIFDCTLTGNTAQGGAGGKFQPGPNGVYSGAGGAGLYQAGSAP